MRYTMSPQIPFSGSLYDIEDEYRPINGLNSCINFWDDTSGMKRRGTFSLSPNIPKNPFAVPNGVIWDDAGFYSWTEGALTYTLVSYIVENISTGDLYPYFVLYKTEGSITTHVWTDEPGALTGTWEYTNLLSLQVVKLDTGIYLALFARVKGDLAPDNTGIAAMQFNLSSGTLAVAVDILRGSGDPWENDYIPFNLFKAFYFKSRLILISDTFFFASETGDFTNFIVPATILDTSPIEINLGISLEEALYYNEGLWVSSSAEQRFISLENFTPTGIVITPISIYPFKRGINFGDGILFHDGTTLRENVSTVQTVNTEARDVAFNIPLLIQEYATGTFVYINSEYLLLALTTKALVIRRTEQRSNEGRVLGNYSFTEMELGDSTFFNISVGDQGILFLQGTSYDFLASLNLEGYGMDFSDQPISVSSGATYTTLQYDPNILLEATALGKPQSLGLWDPLGQVWIPIESIGSNYVRTLNTDVALVEDLNVLTVGMPFESSMEIQQYLPRQSNGVPIPYETVNLRSIEVTARAVDYTMQYYTQEKIISGTWLGETLFNNREAFKKTVKMGLSGSSTVSISTSSMFPATFISYVFKSTNNRRG